MVVDQQSAVVDLSVVPDQQSAVVVPVAVVEEAVAEQYMYYKN